MKKLLFPALSFLAMLLFIKASATILRVNSTPGMAAPYSNLASAIAAAASGDTIYVEGSSSIYTGVTINKKLRIIGTGYFLDEPNPKTQSSHLESELNTLTFGPGSKGSVVQGLVLSSAFVKDSFITIERCYINTIYMAYTGSDVYGDTVRNNFLANGINMGTSSGTCNALVFYNNICTGSYPFTTNTASNGYIVNNVFAPNTTSFFVCSNFLFQNNIIKNPSFGSYLPLNVFHHNISTNAAGIPSGSGNILGADWNSIFTDDAAATSDGKFLLSASSVARDAGIMNSVAIDCGAFGGVAPYILSGMPNVPSIYELEVPDEVPPGTDSILINISAASH